MYEGDEYLRSVSMIAWALGPGGRTLISGRSFWVMACRPLLGRSQHPGLGLLTRELRDVVRAAPALAGRAGGLPAAERLHARPRAGGRAGLAVGVEHAR